MKKTLMTMIFAAFLTAAGLAHAETYTFDTAHTSIGFNVTHLLVSQTYGRFKNFEGTLTMEENDPTTAAINVTIQADSIDTDNEKRDAHLRTSDFFDVGTYPQITFQSLSVTGESGDYQIKGNLTIRGVTKTVIIPAKISGPVANPFGGQVIGISGTTSINRQDFGVSWNKQLDQGGYMVGDEVTITISAEAHQS